MNVKIEFIPTTQMRYATWGDWFYADNGDLVIQVVNDESDLPTPEHQLLVAVHELVEWALCRKRGITQKQVDDWDISRATYAEENDLELGDMPGSPYQKEHRFAMLIEHLLAHELQLAPYGTVK